MSAASPVEEKPSSDTSYIVGGWPSSTPGHTGYLTVATLPPPFVRSCSKRPKLDDESMNKNCEHTSIGGNVDKHTVGENNQ